MSGVRREARNDGERSDRVKRRRRRRHARGPMRVLIGALVAAGGLLALALAWLLVVFPARRNAGDPAPRTLVLPQGASLRQVAEAAREAGLVADAASFALYMRAVGAAPVAGPHWLPANLPPGELSRRLCRRSSERVKVTLPEGFNRFDIARKLGASGVSAPDEVARAATDPTLLHERGIHGESAEGFLFPATYDFAPDTDAADVVRRLTAEFDRRFAALERKHPIGRGRLERSFGWQVHEIVTLASLVEREARVDEERPIVASVFLNRLESPTFRPRYLQSDPTSGYGCLVDGDRIPACAGFTGKITHGVNVDPANRYSTYVREGLPPGPIANPGEKSLAAVLQPAATDYLYFVARGEGHHVFSSTLEEHNAAVRALRARGQ